MKIGIQETGHCPVTSQRSKEASWLCCRRSAFKRQVAVLRQASVKKKPPDWLWQSASNPSSAQSLPTLSHKIPSLTFPIHIYSHGCWPSQISGTLFDFFNSSFEQAVSFLIKLLNLCQPAIFIQPFALSRTIQILLSGSSKAE